jgi:hypothetical protein
MLPERMPGKKGFSRAEVENAKEFIVSGKS